MSFPKAGKDDDLTSYEALGLDLQDRPIFRPAGSAFTLIEMPAGTSKTTKLVVSSILRRAVLANTPPPSSKNGEGQT